MEFETEGQCFVCGEKNPGGLRLKFDIDQEKKTLRTVFTAREVYQGWNGVVHGGIVSTLLDEAIAKLAYDLGYEAVTATLEIRFKNPAPVLEPLHVFGEITEVSKRLVRGKSRVEGEDGTLFATASSTLMRFPKSGARRP